LKELKESIASKEEEQKEQETLDSLTGYWVDDVNGDEVYKITLEESMWAILESGNAKYNELSSFDISENQQNVTVNTSEGEIEITNLDEKQMTLDGLEYRKVTEEEMQDILESAGTTQTVDEFFDAENIKTIENF